MPHFSLFLLALLTACSVEPAERVYPDSGPGGGDSSDGTDSTDGTDTQSCDVVEPSRNGCVVTEWSDAENNNRTPEVLVTQHDGQGRVISTDYRDPNDADAFTFCSYGWHRDDLLEVEWCVGRSTYSYSWTFDADDHPSGKVYDAGLDDLPDKIWVYTTDAEGRIILEEQDEDIDGITDSTTAYQYDAQGRLSREEWDYQADGVPDYFRSYVYDAAGRLEEVRIDEDASGSIDRRITTTYADDGRVLRIEEDEDGDGITDVITENRWVDCALEETVMTRSDGLQTTRRYQWYDDGRIYQMTDDWDSDGRPDALARYEHVCPE